MSSPRFLSAIFRSGLPPQVLSTTDSSFFPQGCLHGLILGRISWTNRFRGLSFSWFLVLLVKFLWLALSALRVRLRYTFIMWCAVSTRLAPSPAVPIAMVKSHCAYRYTMVQYCEISCKLPITWLTARVLSDPTFQLKTCLFRLECK